MASNAARRVAEEFTKKYGTGLPALIKQGWNEYPEVLSAITIAVASTFVGSWAVYKIYQDDGHNREFKTTYVIMRPDDPRADNVRRLREKKARKDAAAAAQS